MRPDCIAVFPIVWIMNRWRFDEREEIQGDKKREGGSSEFTHVRHAKRLARHVEVLKNRENVFFLPIKQIY